MLTTLNRCHFQCDNDFLLREENPATVCKSRFEIGRHGEPSNPLVGNSIEERKTSVWRARCMGFLKENNK